MEEWHLLLPAARDTFFFLLSSSLSLSIFILSFISDGVAGDRTGHGEEWLGVRLTMFQEVSITPTFKYAKKKKKRNIESVSGSQHANSTDAL